ncbi:MAG: aminotransferase class I/II-fold pyridoxal phosphate-dependent enzyme, partial [Aquihabitans sp.]
MVADAFGSEQAFFSTNGSTLSMELAVLTAVQPGEQILVERNIHKSVVSGIVTSGARPVWAVPELDEGNAMSHCVTADAVRAALDRDPGIRAALIVSPTYFGAAADVRGIADACHEHGIPLVVDDAWGALFRFHPDLPEDPIGAGADLVISSFHKSIPAIMQCSVMNVQGDRIDRDRLSLCLDSMESTSASALLLASMDGARQQVVLHGEELLGRTLALADRAADEIGRLPGLRVLGPEIIDGRGVVGFDRTKVTIDLTDLGVDGYEAADWLYEECGVAAELDDYRHLMFLVTLGDDDASIDRLIDGLRRLAEHGAGRSPLPPMAWAGQLLRGAEYVADVRTAFLGPVEQVPITESIGRLAAEPISPYPPGVPVLIPGQRITAEIVDHLRAGLERGMLIKGVTDP